VQRFEKVSSDNTISGTIGATELTAFESERYYSDYNVEIMKAIDPTAATAITFDMFVESYWNREVF